MKLESEQIRKIKKENILSIIDEIILSLKPNSAGHQIAREQAGQNIYNKVFSDIKSAYNTRHDVRVLASKYFYTPHGRYFESDLINLLNDKRDEIASKNFRNSFEIGRYILFFRTEIKDLLLKDKTALNLYP